jgi:hypothetical protein
MESKSAALAAVATSSRAHPTIKYNNTKMLSRAKSRSTGSHSVSPSHINLKHNKLTNSTTPKWETILLFFVFCSLTLFIICNESNTVQFLLLLRRVENIKKPCILICCLTSFFVKCYTRPQNAPLDLMTRPGLKDFSSRSDGLLLCWAARPELLFLPGRLF